MAFSEAEKRQLLSAKFVGETVIKRLEQMGINSLSQLADIPAEVILHKGSELTGTSCWRNSPQAKQAIANAIACAKRQ